MRKEQGFTLIELLIVLAILAILIGIVALSIGGLRETALKRSMQAEREVVETGLNAYLTLATPLATVPDQYVGAVQISPGVGTIGEYLRKTTRFYYTYINVGKPNQEIIAWDKADDDATICCTVEDCYVEDATATPPVVVDPTKDDSDPAEDGYTCGPVSQTAP